MENNERREFLKKIAYKAPAVIALGTLVAPTTGSAFSKLSGGTRGSKTSSSSSEEESSGDQIQ